MKGKSGSDRGSRANNGADSRPSGFLSSSGKHWDLGESTGLPLS